MNAKNCFLAKVGPWMLLPNLGLASLSSNLYANILGMFPGGPGCKSAAMETAGDCLEGQTLFYNPAVMSRIQPGFSGELGVARLEYGYEHPAFDPVRISLVTPMFSEGWKGLLLSDQLAWGFAVMPSSSADLDIKGLPRRVDGNPEALNVKASKKQFHFALGASYLWPQINLATGLSLIYTYDHRTLRGAAVTNPATILVDMKGTGNFVRPVTGLSWLRDSNTFGLAYMFPLTKAFSGKTRLAVESAPFKTEQVDYDPGVLLTNVKTNLSAIELSGNVNRVFGAKGRGIHRDGLNRRTTEADLHDVNHVGARASYNAGSYGTFALGAAYLDSYWREGFYYKDNDGIPHHEIGHLFGQFNAIPVRNQAFMWQKTFNEWETKTAVFRSAGTTSVGVGGDNPGYYQIEFISLTCSVRRAI
jgi:hypothetical protein